MSVVLEAVAFGASRRERQDGIETIQGLNGSLLIDAEHGCVLRRAQIEAEDVGGFGFELGIVAGHVAFQAVSLQARFLPNPMHSVFTDPQRGGQFAATPVRRPVAGLSPRSGQDAGAQSGRQHTGFLTRMIGVQSLESVRKRSFQRTMVGAVVLSCSLIALKDAPSASIRINLARNTYPAGRERDWAMLLRSERCCWVSKISLPVARTALMLTV